jgi:GNAT superfamily N-acetyltransferase
VIRDRTRRGALPVQILALHDGAAVGVATLKERDSMATPFPRMRHWLSGVYAAPNFRQMGVATALSLRIIDTAASLDIDTLYLQTEALDGGLYARLGWMPVERVRHDGLELLIMEKKVPRGRADG